MRWNKDFPSFPLHALIECKAQAADELARLRPHFSDSCLVGPLLTGMIGQVETRLPLPGAETDRVYAK